MDQVPSKQPLPALPTEVWKLVADYVSTREWARASCTCRAMAAVLPRSVALRANKDQHYSWLGRMWTEAESVELKLGGVPAGLQPGILGQSSLAQLERLDMSFRRDFHLPFKRSFYQDEGRTFHPWTAAILERAPKLAVLHLETKRISTLPSHAMSQLKHLTLSFEDPLTTDVCAGLQNLCKLKTLALNSTCHYSELLELPEINLKPCTSLRALALCRVRFAALQVPEGCSVFTKGYLRNISAEWMDMPGMSTACHFEEGDDLEEDCDWLCDFTCLSSRRYHNLTSLRIDSYFKKLCTWENPIVIGACLEKLEHLVIFSQDVHLRFTSSFKLQTLVLAASECISIHLENSEGDLDAFAENLTRVYFQWRCCCRNTYSLLGRLREPCTFHDGRWCSKASMPASFDGQKACRCGTCYACLGWSPRNLQY